VTVAFEFGAWIVATVIVCLLGDGVNDFLRKRRKRERGQVYDEYSVRELIESAHR
jgi:hypothetical protein